MKYAPILIPTLCRDKHFIRLVESLKRNTWAKYTDIYIGLDFPPSKKYEEGYKSICQYLEGDFFEFASFNVIKHSENVGSSANMESLREIVFKKYDRFIRTDDDTEFSPNFIEYVDKCLMEYEDDSNVIAVTGYSYPIKCEVSDNATIFKENFICPMWGTGFWVKKYTKIKNQIENGYLQQSVDYVFNNNLMDEMLDVSKVEYVNLCLSPIFKKTLACKMTDIAVRMYTAINNKYIICPIISKVRNWGFDGSGEYCSKIDSKNKIDTHSYIFNLQPIDDSSSFTLIPDNLKHVDRNRQKLNTFETVSWFSLFKIQIKKTLYLLLRKKLFYKLYKLLQLKFK